MKCPFCAIDFHADWRNIGNANGDGGSDYYEFQATTCSACFKTTFKLKMGRANYSGGHNETELQVYPRGELRPIAPEVPLPFSEDHSEAIATLPVSAKASAAISRRNLQAVLRDVLGIKKSDLSKEIDEFIARPGTPTSLASAVDAVRTVGNFAAHPIKDTATGQVVPVEPQEAEWLLDVMDELFDYAFVQPQRLAAKQAALNAKLASAGKPPLKK